jgi:hypothetical protein
LGWLRKDSYWRPIAESGQRVSSTVETPEWCNEDELENGIRNIPDLISDGIDAATGDKVVATLAATIDFPWRGACRDNEDVNNLGSSRLPHRPADQMIDVDDRGEFPVTETVLVPLSDELELIEQRSVSALRVA